MKAHGQRANAPPVRPSSRSSRLARLYNPRPHRPSTLFRSPPLVVSGADLDPCGSPTAALERNRAMASSNKFALLDAMGDKGVSEYLYQDFDARGIAALAHLLADLGGDDVEDDLVADHEGDGGDDLLADDGGDDLEDDLLADDGGDDLEDDHVEPAVPDAEELVPHEDLNADLDPVGNVQEDDPLNPWKPAAKIRTVRKNRVAAGDRQPIPPQDNTQVKVCVEVLWVPKLSSRRRCRRERKHAQARKSRYVPTKEGPGVYGYGTFGQFGLGS